MLRTAILAALTLTVLSSGGCAHDQATPPGTGGTASASPTGALTDGSTGAGAASAGSSATAPTDTTGGSTTPVATISPAQTNPPVATTPPAQTIPPVATTPPAQTTPAAPAYRGDDSSMPSFGGWAWGNVPAAAVAQAGFQWFETGYPGDVATNQTLLAANIRPFAYINLGELDPSLASQANYTGAVLRTNGDWGTQLVDVTDASWQDWIVRRTEYAYSTGSRGVKWDVATPDVPPGKTRSDVNAAIASLMQRILATHPDLKFIFNQGFEFALAFPQYVHAIETEGLFSASSWPAAFLQPWLDPWYWGPQYQQAKTAHERGIRILCAEYADPASDTARQLYGAITAQGFVPYITSETWNIRGWGYNVPAGW